MTKEIESVLPLDKAPSSQHRFCPECGFELDKNSTINWGGWSFNESKYQFEIGTPGSAIHFTKTEALVIGTILRGHGNTLTKEGGLFSAICNGRTEADWPDFRMVDVIVCKIRKKLKAANLLLIDTTWGRGYFSVPYTDNPDFTPRPMTAKIIPFYEKTTHLMGKPCRDCHHSKTHHKMSGKFPNKKYGNCRVDGCKCGKYKP